MYMGASGGRGLRHPLGEELEKKMMTLEYVLTGEEMADCDRRTSVEIGIPSLVLMERAALSVADGVDEFLRGKEEVQAGGQAGHPPEVQILVVAGKGNNGADALAAGRILMDRGYGILFYRLPGEISPDSSFAVQEQILRKYGCEVRILDFSDEFPSKVPEPRPGGIVGGGVSFSDGNIMSVEASRSLNAYACPEASRCIKSSAYPERSFSGEPGHGIRVIIDGLFGTGLSRDLAGDAARAVAWINRLRSERGLHVVAVDIPSGISSDDGRVMGCAVHCDETRTFAFYKRGHFLYPGASFAGEIHLAQIGITARSFASRPGMFTCIGARPGDLFPVRTPDGNKGTFGKLLIIAGRRNMCGAALLSARAALFCGAGMVKLFTHESNRVIVQQAFPEAMLETWTEEEPLQAVSDRLCECLRWADVAAAGPAMGTDEAAKTILRTVLEWVSESENPESISNSSNSEGIEKPESPLDPVIIDNPENSLSAGTGRKGKKLLRGLVLDADALRILAADPQLRGMLVGRRSDVPCVLTPHLAEFAALAGRSVGECAGDRSRFVQEQADSLRCVIACKDARTLVAMPGDEGCDSVTMPKDEGAGSEPPIQYLNTTGNSGMATAGSGDVLTGMTAAFLALFTASAPERPSLQKGRASDVEVAAFEAAWRAVCLHGLAGDFARDRYGERGMSAGDIADSLRDAAFWQEAAVGRL